MKFSSKNSFLFKINNKYKLNNFEIKSEILINEFSIIEAKKLIDQIYEDISKLRNKLEKGGKI